MNYPKLVQCILVLSISFHFSSQQALADDQCILDTKTPSSWTNPKGNWGGFLNNTTCGSILETYLFVLAKRANKTGEIFLNITEQKVCLSSMNTTEKDALSCGIERLTSGSGGCSDYTVTDVVNEQGNALQSLDLGCKNLDSNSESDGGCNSCLGTWDQMIGSANTSNSLIREEVDVCRFSVLVSLTSRRINDITWMNSVYTCLGNGTSIDDEAKEATKMTIITGAEVVVGGVGGFSVVVATVWLVFFKKRSKAKPPKDACHETYSQESSSGKISLKEVRKATDNLSATNFIGQGVAGKVYKGVLSNGQRVAIKHIINDGQMETFVREVTSLSHVKHPNLVELLGHCDGEDESFLVYQLCDNGNLSEWLFGKHKFLTWIQRLQIALDCARGLWFLHTYPEGCIVHRDVKPTNILLGTNFEAKLSDFGLSKVITMGFSHVSSEVRGTFGYVDPEYQRNRHVHSSTDVYSFGIVLLQILSGQRVLNLELTRPMPLSRMAKNVRKGGDITEFADPKLNGEYSVEAFGVILKVALSCTGIKNLRPSMERVVAMLEKALLISQSLTSIHSSFQSL